MTLKSVFAPYLARNVKFGRRPSPLGTQRRLRLEDYAKAAGLPTPPPQVDYTPKATLSLKNVLKNDVLGDCVIAGGYHVEGVATGNATGTAYVPTDAQIIRDYSAIGGYVPGDESTDNGCDLSTAIAYWKAHGFSNGTFLTGGLKLNPADVNELKLALWLFENIYMGVSLPDAWITPFPSRNGFVWDVAGPANPDNGHCFIGGGYGPISIMIDTWGLLGTLTWAGAQKYLSASAGGEVYALLTPDLIAKGQAKAPNGLDWAALVADFNALGGSVPAPTPPIPPTPAPVQGLTLVQAAAAAAAGLASAWPKGH